MSDLKSVTIWTDGACIGNPGPGGHAAVLLCDGRRRVVSGGYRRTTNNRMELLAVIAALRVLKFRCAATVLSDARYVVDGATLGTMHRHRRGGWVRGNSVVPNADLWDEMLSLCDRHVVTFSWVEAHAGIDENETCDGLALLAAQAADLAIDHGYENPASLLAVCAQSTLFDLREE